MDTTVNFRACWNYWKGMPTATIRQFVKLSYGLDPHLDPLHEVGGERQWSLLAAVRYGYITCLGQEPSHDPELPRENLHPVDQVIDIRQATAWAMEKGWDIPDQLRETILPDEPTSTPSITSDWGRLTPEQKNAAWEAMSTAQREEKTVELLKKYGGNKAAAGREVGITGKGIQYHLDKAKKQPEVPPEVRIPIDGSPLGQALAKPRRG